MSQMSSEFADPDDGGQKETKTSYPNKLDSLRREDLLVVVKKQYISLNAAKKQIEEYKNEITEKKKIIDGLNIQISGQNEIKQSESGNNITLDMLSMELNDYKRSLESSNKTLSDCQLELEKKEALLQEITMKYQSTLEEKESAKELLLKSNAENLEIIQLLEDKSQSIREKSNEIDGLISEMSALKSQTETKIGQLLRDLAEKDNQITNLKCLEHKLSEEYQQIKNELNSINKKYADLCEEHVQFKNKTKYLLDQKCSSEGISNEAQGKSAEIRRLIETLDAKNEENSQLKSRCSILEEELQLSRQDIINLESQLETARSLQTVEISRQKNNYDSKISELEQRAENDRKTITDLNVQLSTLRIESDGRLKELQQSWEKRIEFSEQENRSLLEELSRTKRETSRNTPDPKWKNKHDDLDVLPSAYDSPKATEKLMCFDTSFNNSLNIEDAVPNSESDDEEFSLQSIINNAKEEIVHSSQIEYNNWHWEGEDEKSILQQNEELECKLNSLSSQLAHTRELLADMEEMNLKLNEQVQLLKEEIRRSERNREREFHVVNNSEYLKNVLLSFLAPQRVNDERLQILPTLKTMLKLSNDEAEAIAQHIRASQAYSSSSAKSTSNWGSYLGFL